MVLLYMVTFTINIPPMLAYIPYMDPIGYKKNTKGDSVAILFANKHIEQTNTQLYGFTPDKKQKQQDWILHHKECVRTPTATWRCTHYLINIKTLPNRSREGVGRLLSTEHWLILGWIQYVPINIYI